MKKEDINDKLAERLGYRKKMEMYKATGVAPSARDKSKMRRRIVIAHFLDKYDIWELIEKLERLEEN